MTSTGPNPTGICQCGKCGKTTGRAREDHGEYLKGQYHRFLPGHWARTKETVTERDGGPNPSGKCWCKCGGTTERATCKHGDYLQGQYHRYLPEHHNHRTRGKILPGRIDLKGKRQDDGFLVGIRRLDSNGKWLCRCLYNGPDCKEYTEVVTDSFTSGRVQSCGCLRLDRLHEALCKNVQKCDHCKTEEPGQYYTWRELNLCRRCYANARYRGQVEDPMCQWPDCKTRLGVLDGRQFCYEHERQNNSLNRGEAPKDNERFFYGWTTIWQDLDDYLGEWYVFPAIDQHYDCLIWRGAQQHNVPLWHGASLRRLIYLRYVDSDYDGMVYACTENSLCINPDHLNNHRS